jgi:hypothetical protein
MQKEKRAYIYDGAEIVARCRISHNLDFWNGQTNCNPTRGKHKTLSYLPDGRFAIIWSDDQLHKDIGKVVSNEVALIEILKAKKTKFLNRYKVLREMYLKRQVHYDNMVEGKGEKRTNDKRLEEIIIVTKDNYLVGIYSNIYTLKVKRIQDIEKKPKDYYCIWSVEKNGISEYRKLSDLLTANRQEDCSFSNKDSN